MHSEMPLLKYFCTFQLEYAIFIRINVIIFAYFLDLRFRKIIFTLTVRDRHIGQDHQSDRTHHQYHKAPEISWRASIFLIKKLIISSNLRMQLHAIVALFNICVNNRPVEIMKIYFFEYIVKSKFNRPMQRMKLKMILKTLSAITF